MAAVDPKVIVEHYTASDTFASAYNTFAPDHPDSELHELPGTCAHFVIDKDGTIYQLVPLCIRCRHTVGLNWTAIGIEHVGTSAAEILATSAQIASSLALTRWLMARFRIASKNVIGHAESLSSPYHHELVAAPAHADPRRLERERDAALPRAARAPRSRKTHRPRRHEGAAAGGRT